MHKIEVFYRRLALLDLELILVSSLRAALAVQASPNQQPRVINETDVGWDGKMNWKYD